MNTIQYPFEELPSFWKDEFRSGAHNGVAEISYSFNPRDGGNWYVSGISLDCHNGKCGAAASSIMVPVSRAYDGALWEALTESLEHFHGEHIHDAIEGALDANRKSFTAADTEHRLRAHQLVWVSWPDHLSHSAT